MEMEEEEVGGYYFSTQGTRRLVSIVFVVGTASLEAVTAAARRALRSKKEAIGVGSVVL